MKGSVYHGGRALIGSEEGRVLSETDCGKLADGLAGFAQGGGKTIPEIVSWWQGELRWGRNRVTLASDRRDVRIKVKRQVLGTDGVATTNETDDASLEGVVRAAERIAAMGFNPAQDAGAFGAPPPVALEAPRTVVWSDATYNLTPKARAEIAQALVRPAEAKGLLSAGYIEVRAGARLQIINGQRFYVPYTHAQCSMTVRDPQGTGSGWAGDTNYDWAKIDTTALTEQALQKAVASRNPVALEPGRYTVILEPQAVADLLEILVRRMLRPPVVPGWAAEDGGGPFAKAKDSALDIWRTKLGSQVVDNRLTLSADLADPNLGILPEPGMKPVVTWIDRGVLTGLDYWRSYAVAQLGLDSALRSPALSYRLSGNGPETSIPEMIATTKRGVLVSRFWEVRELALKSLLASGMTRDGLWLIEDGKITKPVKNFRFTESPLFALNQLEQFGKPERVFRPVRSPDVPGLTPAVVPALKVRDFSFTSMADAV